jgi:uncharacterized protein (TIGR02246 family)
VNVSNSIEARLRRLEDLQEIHQLFVDYGAALDAGDFARYASLFARDGEVLLGPMGRAKGPAAIEDLMRRTLAGRVGDSLHINSSPQVTLDDDRASATVMWTVVHRDNDGRPRLTMVGHHHDDLVREDGRWRFLRRRGTVEIPASYESPKLD